MTINSFLIFDKKQKSICVKMEADDNKNLKRRVGFTMPQ